MNNKILMVVAFAALSAVAMAQSAPSKDKAPAQGATTQDAASGQASGKRMHKPMTITPDNSKGAPSGGSADRESSAPSVSEVVMTKPATGSKPVATGDVNGDGRNDVAATSGSAKGSGQGASNNGTGNGNGARDVASGHPTGKRQHDPVTVQKQQDSASPKR